MKSDRLRLTGLHFHLGSQLFDPEPYQIAIEKIFDICDSCHFTPQELSPGGGWGVQYTELDSPSDPSLWIKAVAGSVVSACDARQIALPRLILEPGRWLVARAGVAIYKAGYQKNALDAFSILAVDGGLADNPRNALYQAKYTACNLMKLNYEPSVRYRIVGKYCESGDVLIDEIQLPPTDYGDYLMIPVSGAYQLSMASNYNLTDRPAVLWLKPNGIVETLQNRENIKEKSWWK